MNDGYLGSGIGVKRAIKKYGKKNFKREILEFCESYENVFDREFETSKKLNVVDSSLFYNNEYGGRGHCKKATVAKATRLKISKTLTGRKTPPDVLKKKKETRMRWTKERKEIYRQKRSELSSGVNNPMYGKTHSKESLKIIKERANNRSHAWNEKLSKSAKGRKKIVCEFCGKELDPLNFKKHHGENCKNNQNYVESRELLKCPHCGFESYSKGAMSKHHFDNCKYNVNKIIKEKEIYVCNICKKEFKYLKNLTNHEHKCQ